MKQCVFSEFVRRMDLWELFCYGPRVRMKTWLFLSKLTGISRRGVLKELEVCDFGKTWSHVNETVAVVVENCLNCL